MPTFSVINDPASSSSARASVGLILDTAPLSDDIAAIATAVSSTVPRLLPVSFVTGCTLWSSTFSSKSAAADEKMEVATNWSR